MYGIYVLRAFIVFLCPVFIGNYVSVEDSPEQYYPLVIGNSSTLLSIQDTEELTHSNYHYHYSTLSYILRYSSTRLSVNGTTLSSNPRKFNLSNTLLGSTHLTTQINYQYNASDEGYYIHLLYIFSSDVYFELQHHRFPFQCWCSYTGHYIHAISLNINRLSFPSFHFILRTYSKCNKTALSSITI